MHNTHTHTFERDKERVVDARDFFGARGEINELGNVSPGRESVFSRLPRALIEAHSRRIYERVVKNRARALLSSRSCRDLSFPKKEKEKE